MTSPTDELIQALASPDDRRRSRAVAALVRIGPPAVPALCLALREGGLRVRCGALMALGRIRDRGAVQTVCDALRDREVVVSDHAAAALGEIGDPAAVPALCRALRGTFNTLRPAVVRALGAIGDPAAVSDLCSVASADGGVSVVEALARIGDPRAVSVLLSALHSLSTEERAVAARGLGHIRDPATVADLCRQQHLDSPEVTLARAEALAAFGPEIVPQLLDALQFESVPAAEALVRLDVAAIQPLERLLRHVSSARREQAAELLGRIGRREAGPALVAALQDRSEGVRAKVAVALELLGDPGALPALVGRLDDPAAAVRARAGLALTRLTDPGEAESGVEGTVAPLPESAREPLARALADGLRDREEAVRQRAATELIRLAGEAPTSALRIAIPQLRKLAGAWWSLPDGERELFRSALSAIEEATSTLKDLPVPAARPCHAGSLPLPAAPSSPPSQGQPHLAATGHDLDSDGHHG